MPIVRVQWVTRQDLRAHPEWFFVFGDNVDRRGFGGQAKEMRGEPNAIGVATKWSPSMARSAFFDDTRECHDIVNADLAKVREKLDAGKVVVVPTDGIGTGLSRLPQVAPNLNRYIENWFRSHA